uniref:Uncharacterized protein n=1 Tax=Timema poppense TaxID=170557 RepID=A0A7R9D3B4_TIMPO|nr:unnamed protein product [Timema poppensis]
MPPYNQRGHHSPSNLMFPRAVKDSRRRLVTQEGKEGFGKKINLCQDRGLSLGPPTKKSDTLPLIHQVTIGILDNLYHIPNMTHETTHAIDTRRLPDIRSRTSRAECTGTHGGLIWFMPY